MWTLLDTTNNQIVIYPDANDDGREVAMLPAIRARIIAGLEAGCTFPQRGSCGCAACEPDSHPASNDDFILAPAAHCQRENCCDGTLPAGDYRHARGALPWQPGDELPEDAISRMRGNTGDPGPPSQ